MFDKYLIVENSLRNVTDGDTVVGFAVDSRIAYYRGLGLSMVWVDLSIDGRNVDPAEITFTVHGNEYALSELETVFDDRWGFTEPATITVKHPGGLTQGEHTVSLLETLRVSYAPRPTETRDTKKLTVV